MALTNIPQLYAGAILSKLPTAHVFGAPGVVSREYEGMIQDKGDTVHITGLNDPTISDYVEGALVGPERLTSTDQTLVIDQAKSFNYELKDLTDKTRVFPKVDLEAAQRAAYGLANAADAYLASKMVAGADTGNKVGDSTTPVALDATNAYETLVRLRIKLDKQNTPQAGRWVVVPSFVEGILSTDQRFIGESAALLTPGSVLSEGLIGRVAGFNVLVSQNVPLATAKYSIVAGYSGAVTFAEQIAKTETLRNPDDFGDLIRGLHVYGAKVVRPKNVAVATVTDASGLDA